MPLTRQQEAIAIGALQGPVGRQLRSEMNYSTNAKGAFVGRHGYNDFSAFCSTVIML